MSQLDTARSIVNGMPDPAVLLDCDLKVLAYNSPFLDLTGLRRRAFEARLRQVGSPLELVGEGSPLEREHALLALRSRKSLMLAEVAVKDSAGEPGTVNISFIPVFDETGTPVGLIEALRDVSGDARVQTRYKELLEVERLRAEHLEREVEKRTRELTAALEQVTRMSREDPLTGLLNRRAFTEQAELALKLARRHRRVVAVLVADLDYFKKVNDTYGHQAGDAVLVETASLLRSLFRDSDGIARFGGEEFVILLSETSPEPVREIGERARAAIEQHGHGQPIAGVKFPTASIGMAIFPEHGETLDQLISSADAALYQAKERGRNCAVLYDPSAPVESTEDQPPRTDPTPRVLIAGGVAGSGLSEALNDSYKVVVADEAAEALELCEREPFDVLIGDLEVDDSVAFLRQSLRVRPEALRVLVIDTEDVFVEVRGTNVARVDCFLLRRESAGNIVAAIDNALCRRESDRQRMLLDNSEVRRRYIERLGELDDVIEQRQLGIAFQPIVDPRTGMVRAYEALARARHPLFKNATVLFEAAVQSGNLWRLGRLSRDIAMTSAERLPEKPQLFLNLHPGEIDDPELIAWGMASGGSDRIVFEITERTAIPDFRRFRNTARALVGRGFRFAIDDLGAGYASLNAVALLEPAFVKLDMAMVRGVDQSVRKQRLIGRMVEFANDVGIELVAEGVETAEEARWIAELGCHLAQGYFFGRPAERTPSP